jgi:hypothetical protein
MMIARFMFVSSARRVEVTQNTPVIDTVHVLSAILTAMSIVNLSNPNPNPKESTMSNQTPTKTRPIDPTKSIANLFPARFLRPDHLVAWGVTQIVVTIDHLQEEEVTPHPGQPAEWKPVLYFRTKTGTVHPQGFLLSAKIDAESLGSATASTTIGDLAGKQIVIQLSSWKNKTVLRISPQPAAK